MNALRRAEVNGGKAGWFVAGVSYVIALVVYLATSARGPAGDDWGDFVASASVLGVAHPSGYPVFLQLLALPLLVFPRVWAAAVADATNAALVAAAPALLALWAFRVGAPPDGGRRAAAFFAVLVGAFFAFMPALWLEATSLEVYGVSLAALAAALILLDVAAEKKDGRFFAAAAFLAGLTPGFHPSTLGYALAALVVWIIATGPGFRPLAVALAAFTLAFSVTIYLPLRDHAGAPLTWSGVGDLHALVRHLAARQFGHNFRWPTGLVARYGLAELGTVAWRNVGPWLVLAPVGVWLSVRRRLAGGLGVLGILVVNLAFLFVYSDAPFPASYRLPFVALVAACAGAAALAFFTSLPRTYLRGAALTLAAAGVVAAVATAWNDMRRDPSFLSYYSRHLLLPQGYRALFFAGLTSSDFLVSYRQYTLNQRRDVEHYNTNDGRYSIDMLTRKLNFELGGRPVFADYIFFLFLDPPETRAAYFRHARATGFIAEISASETPAEPPSRWSIPVLKKSAELLRDDPEKKYVASRGLGLALTAWTYHALYHQYRGEDRDAFYYFARAGALAPRSAVTHNYLANWYLERGDCMRARREGEAARKLEPDSHGVYVTLTAVALREKDYEAALRYAKTAAALKPQDGRSHRLLAGVYLARGETDRGRRELEKTVALGYKDPDTVLALAGIYRAEGRTDKALRLLKENAAESGEPRLMDAYAALRRERGM